MVIDDNYFKDYASSGKPYDVYWAEYSGIPDSFEQFEKLSLGIVRVVAVLGCATGACLKSIHKNFKVKPIGVEINKYAFTKIPKAYKSRSYRMCLIGFLEKVNNNPEDLGFIKIRTIDIAYTNSLVYLTVPEINKTIKLMSTTCKLVHCDSSVTENVEEGDKYIVTLKSQKWWDAKFKKAGFKKIKGTYIYQNKKDLGNDYSNKRD